MLFEAPQFQVPSICPLNLNMLTYARYFHALPLMLTLWGGVSWEWYGMRMRTPAAGLPVALESTHNNLHHTTFTLCTNCCCAVNHSPDILLLFLKTHCVQPHLASRWHQWKQSCVISLSCLQPFWSTFGFRSNVFTLTVDTPPHFKQS